MSEEAPIITRFDPAVRATCSRTGEPLDAGRTWVVSLGPTGYLSPSAARDEAPALWAMLETFYATGVSRLTADDPVEKIIEGMRGSAYPWEL
jgi:hypothetical protein